MKEQQIASEKQMRKVVKGYVDGKLVFTGFSRRDAKRCVMSWLQGFFDHEVKKYYTNKDGKDKIKIMSVEKFQSVVYDRLEFVVEFK